MRTLLLVLTLFIFVTITSSLDFSNKENIENIERDPLNILSGSEFQIDSPIQRIKRGTTIVHHRVRKRRPKPVRKGRRPPKPRPPKPRPVYGPPPTQPHIHIQSPNYPASGSFTSPTGPESQNNNNQYSNHFAEPPALLNFNPPSAPPSSVPFIPSSNSIYNKEVTQFQAQQIPPVHPPRQQVTQQQFGIPAQQPPQQSDFYPQGPAFYQNRPNFVQPAQAPASVLTQTYKSNSRPSQTQPNNNFQFLPTQNFQNDLNAKIPSNTVNEIPTQSIPLEMNVQGDLYQNTVSSYDVPLNSFNIRPNNANQLNKLSATQSTSFIPAQSSINFSPPRGLPAIQYDTQNTEINNKPPNLPTRYEPTDFTAIQTKILDNRYNNDEKTDILDDSSLEKYLNDVSESKRVSVKTRPEKKRKKPKSTIKPKSKSRPNSSENTSTSFFDEDDEDFSFENFPFKHRTKTSTTTTTTKRPKHRRRKRPKVSTTTQHSLEVEDLKDTYESGSEIQEYIVASHHDSNFEPKKYFKVSKPQSQFPKSFIPVSKAPTAKPTTTNYIFFSSPNDLRDNGPEYIGKSVKTEKPPSRLKIPAFTYKPRRVRPTPKQSYFEETPDVDNGGENNNSDEVKILSIQKSKTHNYYSGQDAEKTNNINNNKFDVGFSFPNMENFPEDFNTFTSGVFLTNGGFGTRIKHGRAKKDMDSEEDYIFEAEYEIELPNNHRFYKK